MPSIIVVGGGLAGLSATIEAYKNGADVVLIEKQSGLFGNSCKASSGMNALSQYQVVEHIEDSYDAFYKDTMKSGHFGNDPMLVQVLINNSKAALQFLESFGLSLGKLSQCGGHSKPRTHRQMPTDKPSNVGWAIISTLKQYIVEEQNKKSMESYGSIDFQFNSEMTDLIVKDGKVSGIEVNKTTTMVADAVILATGGYCHDYSGYLQQYTPNIINLPTTNGAFALGQGIKIAHKHGAILQDMEFVQIHPTGFIKGENTKFLAPEALRGSGALLINEEGKRFVNELESRDVVTQAIFKQQHVYLLMNQASVDLFGPSTLSFYISKDLFTKYNSIEQVITHMKGSSAVMDNLHSTFTTYGIGVDPFNKAIFPVSYSKDSSEWYIAEITPVIHYSMGGIKINAAGEVLQRVHSGSEVVEQPIIGLYACGETSSKVHGQNRLAGNSLLECVVFGRICGQRSLSTASTNTIQTITLRAKLQLTQSITLFRFDLPSTGAMMNYKVGQYIQYNYKGLKRYYSPISRPDDKGKLDLLIKVNDKGQMSTFFNEMALGEAAQIEGPLGDTQIDFTPQSTTKKLILIAGGTGIAPMIQMIRSVFYHELKMDIHLVYGANEPNELVYKDYLIHKALNHTQLTLTFLVDQPHFAWPVVENEYNKHINYGVGFCTSQLLEQLEGLRDENTKIVICGPYKMCQGLKQTLNDMKVTNYYSYM